MASLLWSKQFYHLGVLEWLEGDPALPKPPDERWHGRNSAWQHLYNRDVVSMPDNWEFPWYASWDIAFHMVAVAEIDPYFAKEQLILLLREWYTNPGGQIPAYEFEFSDVNPPVQAWAAWRVYKIAEPHGKRDRAFLERVFQKLLINFTWWVNRKDVAGKQVFSGGFLDLFGENLALLFVLFVAAEIRTVQLDLWRQYLDPMICRIHHRVRDQHLVSLFAYVAKSCHQRLPNRLTIRILFIFCEAADPIWSCDLRLRFKSLFDDRNGLWRLIPRGLGAMPS
jgi:hypothetical protein